MRRGARQPVNEEQTLKATTDAFWHVAEPRMHLENGTNAAATETQPSGFGERGSIPDKTNAQTLDK